jgi:hAT family C-terminal dimerisation region
VTARLFKCPPGFKSPLSKTCISKQLNLTPPRLTWTPYTVGSASSEGYFVSSKFVFKSEDLDLMSVQQRMGVPRRQLTAYMSRGGLVANGIWASLKPGANVSVALLIANGWLPDGCWREFGSDTPELCQAATGLLGMVPSSRAVERSFSLQKRIHSKVRNRLVHETVRQLMFVHCSLKLWILTGQSVMTI